MTTLRLQRLLPAMILASAFAAACGGGTSEPRQVPVGPTAPSGPSGGSGTVTLSTPAPVSPVNGEQLSTLRPTLTVQNATSSNQSGTRTYEFQVSDNTDFSIGASLTASFLVSVSQTGVAEGGDGRTSFTVPNDLQPATRMYWRARVVQGTSTSSEWTSAAMFKTKLVGYNRPGELYDPLIHSESIGAISGSHTWIPGKGLRLDTERSYVRYQLGEAISSGGEFSVEVEGLHPNGPNHKLKIFSMNDKDGDISFSDMGMSTMYRGVDGNPPNCIAFKAVFGSQSRIAEPNRATAQCRHPFTGPVAHLLSGKRPGAATSISSSWMGASTAIQSTTWRSRKVGRYAERMPGLDRTRPRSARRWDVSRATYRISGLEQPRPHARQRAD